MPPPDAGGEANGLQGALSWKDNPGREKVWATGAVRGALFWKEEGRSGCAREGQNSTEEAAENDVTLRGNAVASCLDGFKKRRGDEERRFDLIHDEKKEACGTDLWNQSSEGSTELAGQVDSSMSKIGAWVHGQDDEMMKNGAIG